jgi:hypothetical protein
LWPPWTTAVPPRANWLKRLLLLMVNKGVGGEQRIFGGGSTTTTVNKKGKIRSTKKSMKL